MDATQALPKAAPASLVAQMKNEAMAVSVSLKASGHKAAWVAASMGRSESWLSRIRHGSLRLPDALLTPFCALTGTTLLAQYRALQDALAEAEERMSEDRAAELFAERLRRAA